MPGFVEQVVTCARCGARSSDDLSGRKHWQMVTRSSLIVIDVCPQCQSPAELPPAANTTKSNGRA